MMLELEYCEVSTGWKRHIYPKDTMVKCKIKFEDFDISTLHK